jgi:hypothetical protein
VVFTFLRVLIRNVQAFSSSSRATFPAKNALGAGGIRVLIFRHNDAFSSRAALYCTLY